MGDRSARALPRGAPLGLALVTLLSFLPAIRNGFVWDDFSNLVANPAYRGLGGEQLRWILTAIHVGHYVPVTWLSFAVDHALWGMDPFGYHLSSLVLHAANVVFFAAVAERLLQRATTLAGTPLAVATVVATLFFAIHPLRAESVAWVTERRDVLSGGFLFLTVLAYLRAIDAATARRRWWLAASLGGYGLALASKSIVMTFPAVVVLLNVYPLRRLPGPEGWFDRAARAVWTEVALFAVPSALMAGLAYGAQMAAPALGTYPWSTRLVVAFYALWFYVAKTALPLNLGPLYEVPIPLDPLEPRFVAAGLGVLAVSAAVLMLRSRWPAGSALWAYYVIALSPTLGIVVRAGFQLAADRYSYLACLGWALAVGAAAGAVARARARGTLGAWPGHLAGAAAVAGLVGLGFSTWHQVQIWRDSEQLWSHAVRVDPDCALCHTNLGLVWLDQGDLPLAVHHLRRAVALRPDRVLVREDLGLALARSGQLPEAVAEYRAVLEQRPQAGEVRQNLARALIRMGRSEEAVEQLRIAERLAGDDARAQVSLGFTFYELGRPADAADRFRRALELGADAARARFGLVQAYLALGRPDLAREQYELLRALSPRLAGRVRSAFPSDFPADRAP